ncbi:ribosomal RNA processing protein 1 homolog B-like [Rhipicephalus sanguineus]|uniref:ribosomal RNA processing protein 1 homolog B-like n=1 Tax=Rhipicephalus sanguineus TaxID=34632 RepID=UPI001894C245|nr:ribosomal RNA processing protein 1 homolog B-like [Rhipicephalus sanguineus]
MLSSTAWEEKRVIFALSKNKAQDPREYFETLKNSPEIPFDASKKPAQGVLKARLSLPSSTPVSSAKKRVKASNVFGSNDSHLSRKKRPNASDFF